MAVEDKSTDLVKMVMDLISGATTLAGLGPAGYVVFTIVILAFGALAFWARGYLADLAKKASEEEARKAEAGNQGVNQGISDGAAQARDDIEAARPPDEGKKERPSP